MAAMPADTSCSRLKMPEKKFAISEEKSQTQKTYQFYNTCYGQKNFKVPLTAYKENTQTYTH